MRTIAHISDLHFGREDRNILPALRAAITEAAPNVVVVSGDLTQRARTGEFVAARQFLDTLPKPQIIVPGNHDIPLYNLYYRWRSPLKKYRRYISNDLEPFVNDSEIAVLGLNTARSLSFKNGRLNGEQVASSCMRMREIPQVGMRIVVTHHPFDVATSRESGDIVGRAEMAMAEFTRCKIDVILTGHLHTSRTSNSAQQYGAGPYTLFIQAGTATSIRQRGELNSWNLIKISGDQLVVDCMSWIPDRGNFEVIRTEQFTRTTIGWLSKGLAKATQNADQQ